MFVNDVLVIERGAVAMAHIVKAKPAGVWGRAGMLAWAMEYVVAVDGTRIPKAHTRLLLDGELDGWERYDDVVGQALFDHRVDQRVQHRHVGVGVELQGAPGVVRQLGDDERPHDCRRAPRGRSPICWRLASKSSPAPSRPCRSAWSAIRTTRWPSH